jgi:hypothetical protein
VLELIKIQFFNGMVFDSVDVFPGTDKIALPFIIKVKAHFLRIRGCSCVKTYLIVN